jgi:hypothetical protein
MDEHRKVPKRIAQTVLNSLKGGVVPRIGLPYITVGRKNEIEALLHDVDIISEGGASFRFIVGRYGSGKSFLLQIIRNYVTGADLAFAEVSSELLPFMLHGTGDLYASALLAAVMSGRSLIDAVAFAGDFVRDALRITCDQPDYEIRGVSFETILSEVTTLIA